MREAGVAEDVVKAIEEQGQAYNDAKNKIQKLEQKQRHTQEQNERLRRNAEATKGRQVDTDAVKEISTKLLTEYSSKYEKNKLYSELQDLESYLFLCYLYRNSYCYS